MEIFNEIAREIKKNTNKTVNKATSSFGLELATITSSGLKLDNFKYEIQDYMMLEHLMLDDEYNTEIAGEHSHSHVIKTPTNLKKIKNGDRVLVALLGNEFVVVGRVV